MESRRSAHPPSWHFCGALLVSAILSAPWHARLGPAVLLGLTGVYGNIYAARTLRRMSRVGQKSAYTPGFDIPAARSRRR
jgi:hypothetical protein